MMMGLRDTSSWTACTVASAFPFFIIIAGIVGVLSLDVKPQQENYLPDYDYYHNLSSIEDHLRDIVLRNPSFMKIDWSYRSRQNRPQLLLRISNFTSEGWTYTASESVPRQHNKVKVLLSYGEHAREFLPVETMFNLVTNLTQGLTAPRDSPEEIFSRTILSKVDLYIVALMNPDGRHVVEKTENYCWRGTSKGVDLNRNFDWQFGHKGSSSSPDDEEYRGEEPFSEPECLVLVEMTSKIKFDAFISLHSGIRQIYVPFADSSSKVKHTKPANVDAMLELADVMSHATVNSFTYGLAYQLNQYTADGTIFDYMAGVRNIPFSFAIELWGDGDYKDVKCFDLFNPPSADLRSATSGIQPLYASLFTYLIKWKTTETAMYMEGEMDAPPLELGYILLGLVILLTLFVAIHSRLPVCMRLYPKRRVISIRSLSSTFSLSMNR